MDSKNVQTSSGGVGFAGLLTILFIALKLTHVVDWSWFWVLSPLWISAALGIVFLIAFGVIALLTIVIGNGRK